MTLREYFELHEDDIDVTDTEIDMLVAFCPDDSNDNYSKFLQLLEDKVTVTKIMDDVLVCDFSGFAKPFNDKIYDLYQQEDWFAEFTDKDEYYYNFVNELEGLIAGYTNDSTYKVWIDLFTS